MICPQTFCEFGLAVVKRMVELHGGTIDVQSEVGKGTRFPIAIPLSSGREKTPRGSRPEVLS